MATRFTLIPQGSQPSAVIDGFPIFGMDYAGLPADVAAIHWYGSTGTLERIVSLAPYRVVEETLSSPDAYLVYVSQAETRIYWAQNPEFYYSTVDGLEYEGLTLGLGWQIEINAPDTTPPAESTQLVPPTPEPWQQLYWFNSGWVVSPYDPNETLSAGKTSVITTATASAAMNVDEQARIYSAVQLATAPDVTVLNTADYPGTTLGDYQSLMDTRLSAKVAEINACTQPSQLYAVDPNINGVP